MIAEQFTLRSRHLFLLVITGTIVRFVFGIYSNAWMSAPDQLAWGLSLEDLLHNGNISYKQLIHYPHEGGSFLISCIAVCLHPLDFILPSLSLAALFVDTLSRWIQIQFAVKLFDRATAAWFGLWSVLAVPLLLPWATVNFGLHSLAAFLPFVFIYFATTKSLKYPDGISCGLIAGLAISFSYDAVIFIPAYLIWKLFDARSVAAYTQTAARFIAFSCIALLPHLIIRLSFDNGFLLEKSGILAIRGESWGAVFTGQSWNNWISVLQFHYPASFFLSAGNLVASGIQRYIVVGFCLFAIMLLLIKKYNAKRPVVLMLLLIVVYTMSFAVSPFYSEFRDDGSYVYFRHFAFILPLTSLMIIAGLMQSGKLKLWLLSAWLLGCTYFSITYVVDFNTHQSISYKAAGWTLARKYGDQPDMLKRLSQVVPPTQRSELMMGFGWGLTATLLDKETNSKSENVFKLKSLISQFTGADKELILQGAEMAFAPGITPVLDPKLLLGIETK